MGTKPYWAKWYVVGSRCFLCNFWASSIDTALSFQKYWGGELHKV